MIKRSKKKIILVISVLLIFILISSYFIIDSIVFNNEKNFESENYKIAVTYVVVDYDKTENTDFNDIANYAESIMDANYTLLNVKKKGDHYEAYINNVKNWAYDNVVKATAGINNYDGEVVDDIKYDIDTRIVTIPTKYLAQLAQGVAFI